MERSDYWQRRHPGLSRRRFLTSGAAAGIGTAGLGLVGCGGDDDDGGAGDTPATAGISLPTTVAQATTAAQPVKGGTLKMPILLTADDVWDPHLSLTSAGLIWEVIGNQAVHMLPDGSGLKGELVEKWEIPADGREIILHVRPNVNWHNKPPTNGRAFTAEDLAYNINRITGKYAPDKVALYSRRSTLPNLDEAVAIDNATVRVKLTAPSSGFMNGLADFRNNIAPKDFIENGGDFKDATKLVGTGAFTIDSWSIKQKAVLSAVPGNWQSPLPYLDKIEMIQYSDRLSAQAAFAKGDIDMFESPNKPEREALKKLTDNYREEKWVSNLWGHFRFNSARAPFDDMRIRRAIFMAIDYKNISDSFYGAGYWDWSGPLTGFPEAIPSSEIAKTAGYNPDTKEADRKTAKDLMTAAGFPSGDITFKFLPSSNVPTSANYEAVVRAMDDLKKLWPAINVSIDAPADAPAFAAQQVKGEWDCISYAIGGFSDAVTEVEAHYGSKGSRNYGKYVNASVDDGIAKAAAELDSAKRKELLIGVQKTLIDEMPMARFNAIAATVWYGKQVKGATGYGLVTGTGAYEVRYNLKDVWLERS